MPSQNNSDSAFRILKGDFMKHFKRVITLILALSALILPSCSKDNVETFHGIIFPISLYEDIIIEEGFLYTGAFPEDGSFDEKKDVFALKISNNSSKDIRLLRIYVTTSQKEMLFEITTLPAKSKLTVLEKNAQTLSSNEKIADFHAENRVDFENPVSLMKNTFELMTPNSVFNIKNISDKDIPSDIYVYYKKIDENGHYFGGITFRSKTVGLKSGELKQIPASHFSGSDSEVVFIDYAGE